MSRLPSEDRDWTPPHASESSKDRKCCKTGEKPIKQASRRIPAQSRLFEALMELSAQIEIAILPWWKLGEIDRVVGRNETWHFSLDRSVEQNRLRFHDHVPQSLQRGHHAGRTRACRCHLGSAAQVDTGNRYAELLQSLKLVSRSAVANKHFYAGSPFEQSSRDASAEITGSSRHDDGRVIHDSDIREGGQPAAFSVDEVNRRLAPLQRRQNKPAPEKKCVRVYSSEK